MIYALSDVIVSYHSSYISQPMGHFAFRSDLVILKQNTYDRRRRAGSALVFLARTSADMYIRPCMHRANPSMMRKYAPVRVTEIDADHNLRRLSRWSHHAHSDSVSVGLGETDILCLCLFA
ncbi:hypothetical protein AG1IA_10195 [Rhizoctonia solani AG-1 IA]|uniref:Uncharacterized protein n=1 Tax=Thanatephorus cucumeris (strain AG1-IA) TaxID=983506 RepID=L8WCW5_THACA|nr:hypothetical protein AG1IA_10195 [Rhizoctonia solani AG-1 IA]